MEEKERIVILDYGAQYSQLIARRIREEGVYAVILPYYSSLNEITSSNPAGIILSGGPAHVFEPGAPLADLKLFDLGVPILGICYGMQIIAHLLGGKVGSAKGKREYGNTGVEILSKSPLFSGLSNKITVWMSHGDVVLEPPNGFSVIAKSKEGTISAIANEQKRIYGVQFHPEVTHTPDGRKILANFAKKIAKAPANWTMSAFAERAIAEIREQVKDKRVLAALSGGVDSTVTSVLIHRAIGDQLVSIFVNTGLLREGEAEEVLSFLREKVGLKVRYRDETKRFLSSLKGVLDPEEKRRRIGYTFIRTFEEEAVKLGEIPFLAQGTLYPDVIESRPVAGPSATIKTHHNVGGLPQDLKFKLIEPLRFLFKDEVRRLGAELGIPEEILNRHPFPGPGLAVRIVGEVTEERLSRLRRADAIFIEELKKGGFYDKVWQAFAVLLPVSSVGVMGDERAYGEVVVLRAVTSEDGMTADWAELPLSFLGRVANRIVNEIPGITRVAYDISSKPPATIEWE
ncbi:MAG: glutamine-hydrolyzing GMP synthase [Acidobacteria bacterium]|nr:glutamine-hydrolyzing GMP synthase [Acidobacteriota bacterium]